jgi:hypothetical protein
MNDELPGESRLRRVLWCVEPFGLVPPSLHVCIPFMGQSFALLAQLDGVPYGAR